MRNDLKRPYERETGHRHNVAVRIAASVVALLALAGCSQTMNIETAALRRTVPVETAFVIPPPGGPAIVAVIEERQGRSATQQVLLASDSRTPGEDAFHVEIAARSGDRISTPHNLRAGMRAALPGTPMATSPYLTQNRYGPFGYAVGRPNRTDLCLYGWQTIQSRSTLFMNQGKVDVRLRLCRTGATEAQLLAVMYGYTVNAFLAEGQWNPYQPPALSDAIGQQGREIYPIGPGGPATVLEQAPALPRPARTARAESRPASPEPASGSSVIVPAPPVATVPSPGPAKPEVIVPSPPSP